MKPLRPWYTGYVAPIAIAVCVGVVALVCVMIVADHVEEEAACEQRGGELICPYKSRCYCIDRKAFR